MNLRLRLEKLCDTRAWVRLAFADGTYLFGRALRIGQDYLELEAFGEGKQVEYCKHLIPLGLIKMITVESPQFSEEEKRRLSYVSRIDVQQDNLPDMEK